MPSPEVMIVPKSHKKSKHDEFIKELNVKNERFAATNTTYHSNRGSMEHILHIRMATETPRKKTTAKQQR